MFDDLRNGDDGKGTFFHDEQEEDVDIAPLFEKKPQKSALGFKFNSAKFLGMNAFQRFFISALLLLAVCVLGGMLLMITGSIALY